eukprot:scaffold44821_cov102-Phaeocystis_antarctica.AAC.1
MELGRQKYYTTTSAITLRTHDTQPLAHTQNTKVSVLPLPYSDQHQATLARRETPRSAALFA